MKSPSIPRSLNFVFLETNEAHSPHSAIGAIASQHDLQLKPMPLRDAREPPHASSSWIPRRRKQRVQRSLPLHRAPPARCPGTFPPHWTIGEISVDGKEKQNYMMAGKVSSQCDSSTPICPKSDPIPILSLIELTTWHLLQALPSTSQHPHQLEPLLSTSSSIHPPTMNQKPSPASKTATRG